jgi:hypothetical protein
MQGEMSAVPPPLAELIRDGLGQVTRVFGTRPLPPAAALSTLRELQAQIAGASRFGIPAVAHEECLTGFAAWTATVFPTPLAWGASFDPELVHEMAGAIGASMRSVGIHQGLAPVLDVARNMRWGRTEETIGEDPYLVGSIGTAFVRGLQSAGIEATLKHFAGYSASRTGRNLAPAGDGGPAPLVGTDGTAVISCTVRNTGDRAGTEVVQLYLSDPLAQVVRPLRWLAGFARVPLEPGQARQVTFRLHADRTAFCGLNGARVVEPGEMGVAVGGACDRLVLHGSFTLCGTERPAGADRVLDTPVVISEPS